MSRRTVADLIGRSEEWLRQIENGQRRLDSIDCAIRLGEVLRISDLMATLGVADDNVPRGLSVANLVAPVREALMKSAGQDLLVEASEVLSSASTLDTEVAQAWRCWSGPTNRYQRTLRLLPALLRVATARLRDEVTLEQAKAAISVYHLTRTVISRIGEEQLAWLVADRAALAAVRAGGPVLLASAWHLSVCYLRLGCFGEAYQLATTAIVRAANEESDPEAFILCGAMRLVAAEAAAGMLEPHHAQHQLDQAREVADAVIDDPRPYMIPFGRTEVGITAVQVAFRLGQAGEAIRRASEVEVPDEYLPDRQARYYIPLAYLHARRNEDAAAVFALAKMAAVSPEDIRYDHLAQEAMHRLLRRRNLTVRRELGRLASLAGLA